MLTHPISTDRLTLHPLRKEDEAAAVEIMRSDLVNPT